MSDNERITAVRQALKKFQDGYTDRDVDQIDSFMTLFAPDDDIELIGIGAAVRGGNEWFQGQEQVRDIILSDWQYWGDVQMDVEGAKIAVQGDVAWLSTSGQLVQTAHFDEAMSFYVNQMKTMLEDENLDWDGRMLEATHYGIRRLRERQKGTGHGWPFVITAVLVHTKGAWRFHTVHWSMPVD